jgi:predicted transcriptional regulator
MLQNDSTTLTFRLDKNSKQKLELEAKRTKRSKSFLVQEAVADYLNILEQQDELVRAAIVSADRGDYISHDEVVNWANSLSTEKPLPLPVVTT